MLPQSAEPCTSIRQAAKGSGLVFALQRVTSRGASARRKKRRGTEWANWIVVLLAFGFAACSTAAAKQASHGRVVAAPPPADDGKSARTGENQSGLEHAAALEQLRVARIVRRSDRQRSVLIPLPDAPNWKLVKFFSVKSLVGFRYGKDHHAVVGGFVGHVPDNSVQNACSSQFEQWAAPYIQAFEVEVTHGPPGAFAWTLPRKPSLPASIAIVDVDSVSARTATVLSHESYEAVWAAYPAWRGACLVLGVAVPVQGEAERAREVRDRFAREVLPKVVVTAADEPPELY